MIKTKEQKLLEHFSLSDGIQVSKDDISTKVYIIEAIYGKDVENDIQSVYVDTIVSTSERDALFWAKTVVRNAKEKPVEENESTLLKVSVYKNLYVPKNIKNLYFVDKRETIYSYVNKGSLLNISVI